MSEHWDEVTPVDKTNVRLLFETMGVTIISLHEHQFLCHSEHGLSLIGTQQPYDIQHIDLSSCEPFDEMFFLPSLNRFIFVELLELGLRICIAKFDPFAQPDQDHWIMEDVIWLSTSCRVSGLFAGQDYLFAYTHVEDEDSASPAGRIVLSILFQQDCDGVWQTLQQDVAWPYTYGVPHAMLPGLLITVENRTPFDALIRLYGNNDHRPSEIETYALATIGDTLVCAQTLGETHGVWVIDSDGSKVFYAAPGYVSSLVACQGRAFAVVFLQGTERVYRIDLCNNRSTPVFQLVCETTGKKALFETSDGLAMLTRDTQTGLHLSLINPVDLTMQLIATLGQWDSLDLVTQKLISPQGANAISFTLSHPPASLATIIHFHGGPDSYEVEELRFFGAFRKLLEQGFRLICLNYRGSSGFQPSVQREAWGHWHKTFLEDIHWLTESGCLSPNDSVILSGWSFGGTLALLASQHIPRVAGVIAGGFMADLYRHRERANEQDSLYERWFTARFGPNKHQEDCTRFFTLRNQLAVRRHLRTLLQNHSLEYVPPHLARYCGRIFLASAVISVASTTPV